jgi:prefoldin subunit 5
MRFRWPEDTLFRQMVLDVEQESCAECGRDLHICDHRERHIYTLEGPLELCCRLVHCSDRACPSRPRTLSPAAELAIAVPNWLIGWDVFCYIGHRRFARHWSVPALRRELRDAYHIRLSPDAISNYIHHYQNMLAARQQDFANLQQAYQNIDSVDLTIDGLQPEKGHETLYAVRELKAKRVWFAEALLSSNEAEVRRILVRAKDLATQLGKPIRLWMSDKQDAFVKGIAAEFAGIPHLYCDNHFLRDLAKPTLAKDSSAKVTMRAKVRGLRDIERQVLRQRQQQTAPTVAPANPAVAEAAGASEVLASEPELAVAEAAGASEVLASEPELAVAEAAGASEVLASEPELAQVVTVQTAPDNVGQSANQDSVATRAVGEVLQEVAATCEPSRESKDIPAAFEVASSSPAVAKETPAEGTGASNGQAVSEAASQKETPAEGTGASNGQAVSEAASQVVLDYCAAVRGILNDDQGGPLHPPGLRMAEALTEVRESLQRNLDLNKPGAAHGQLERLAGCIDRGLAEVKEAQEEVKEEVKAIKEVAATLDEKAGTLEERKAKYEELQKKYEEKGGEFHGRMATGMLAWLAGLFLLVAAKEGEERPKDNLALERWFRVPKGHERRIHGHKHAGVRIVQEGPTLLLALDAHLEHDAPFTEQDLLPYRHALPPKDQLDAIQRRKVMRKARSKKNAPPCSKI